MKIRILGCSGGYSKGFHTTSALIDNDLLLDAGTGVGALSCDELAEIDSVLLSHSHLDHVASLCFLVDHRLKNLKRPASVHCLSHTAKMIRENLIGGTLWPDIEEIEIAGVKMIEISEVVPYGGFEASGKHFTPLPVDHVVPTVGYALHGKDSIFVYASDMADAEDRFWDWLNTHEGISHLVMDVSFPSHMGEIAVMSKHMTPVMLKERLERLERGQDIQILAAHLKPTYRKELCSELKREFPGGGVIPLEEGMEFNF